MPVSFASGKTIGSELQVLRGAASDGSVYVHSKTARIHRDASGHEAICAGCRTQTPTSPRWISAQLTGRAVRVPQAVMAS
jgi:hypothetical protein